MAKICKIIFTQCDVFTPKWSWTRLQRKRNSTIQSQEFRQVVTAAGLVTKACSTSSWRPTLIGCTHWGLSPAQCSEVGHNDNQPLRTVATDQRIFKGLQRMRRKLKGRRQENWFLSLMGRAFESCEVHRCLTVGCTCDRCTLDQINEGFFVKLIEYVGWTLKTNN